MMNRTARAVAAPVILFLAAVAVAAETPSYPVKRELDVRIPMRDGVTLSADIYRPDSPGKFPVILVRTPYDNGSGNNSAKGVWWASHGYAYVIQDVRGRGDSDGVFYPLINEAKDGF